MTIEDYPAVLRYCRKMQRINRDLLEYELLQIDALTRADRQDDAIVVIEQFVNRFPDVPQGYLRLAAAYVEAGGLDRARELLLMGQEQLPDDFRLVTAEIKVLVAAGKVKEAEQRAEEALAASRTHVQCAQLCETFRTVGQLELARKWGNQALDLAPEAQKPQVHLMLGNVGVLKFNRDGKRDVLVEARDHFAAALEAQPHNLVAGNNLAFLLATQFDRANEAVRVAEQVRGQLPPSELSMVFVETLAIAYRSAGRPQEAEGLLTEVLAIRPKEARLLFQYGLVLAETQRTMAAITALEKAQRLGLPDDKARQAEDLLWKLARDR
jgi:tetratricopeptide (TPR) repeat protein